ncbi:MAG TPA: DUF177 domain-containing protein [Tenericutes bacterium]|nr:DUF177 domain-containing protein [Mycoplasmatota bacterium]
MNIDVTKLRSGIEKIITIDCTYSFNEEYLKMADLLKIDDVKINGHIIKNSIDNLEIELSIKGIMSLPCAYTLKPVDIPFDIKVNGNLEEMLEEIDQNSKKTINSIDILPIIWENILMEIPMKVISEEASDFKSEGDGWRLITDEEKRINPEFEKLKDLF